MKNSCLFLLLLTFILCSYSCNQTVDETVEVIKEVDPTLFVSTGLAQTIKVVPCTLSNGTTTDCYEIVTNAIATDHDMGPWCPSNISDDANAGGIWLEGGEVYDVDGAFIQNMASFYSDNTWQMYDENGDIYKTTTKQECADAANPN